MKILEVDRYVDSAAPADEVLSRQVPPVAMLTDSSAVLPGRPLFIPEFAGSWRLYLAPAVRINRLGKFIGERFSRRYYDAYTVTARLQPLDVDGRSACSTAFDGAIALGRWIELGDGCPMPELTITWLGDMQVTLDSGQLAVDATVSRLSQFFMLKTGDIVIPGRTTLAREARIDMPVMVNAGTERVLDFRLK